MAEVYILSVSNKLFFCFVLVISERTWLHSEELKFVAKKGLLLHVCMGIDRKPHAVVRPTCVFACTSLKAVNSTKHL